MVPRQKPLPSGPGHPSACQCLRKCAVPSADSRAKSPPTGTALLQIPTRIDPVVAHVRNPNLSLQLLRVKAIPSSWGEPLAGRAGEQIANPLPDTQRV